MHLVPIVYIVYKDIQGPHEIWDWDCRGETWTPSGGMIRVRIWEPSSPSSSSLGCSSQDYFAVKELGEVFIVY